MTWFEKELHRKRCLRAVEAVVAALPKKAAEKLRSEVADLRAEFAAPPTKAEETKAMWEARRKQLRISVEWESGRKRVFNTYEAVADLLGISTRRLQTRFGQGSFTQRVGVDLVKVTRERSISNNARFPEGRSR